MYRYYVFQTIRHPQQTVRFMPVLLLLPAKEVYARQSGNKTPPTNSKVSAALYVSIHRARYALSQMYAYALKYDICNKDYSTYVDVVKYKDRNPNKHDRNKFSKEEVERVWTMKDDPYYQIVLMLLYNGCRISEFLDLKKENVHLEEQYFDVIASKTENGLRKVPIPDKLLPFYQEWYDRHPECEYLLSTPDGKHFLYRNYKDSYYTTIMEQLGIKWSPHCTRHTTISMMKEHRIDETTTKKIVGHSGAMTLTERVYTHLDVRVLIDAINKIVGERENGKEEK